MGVSFWVVRFRHPPGGRRGTRRGPLLKDDSGRPELFDPGAGKARFGEDLIGMLAEHRTRRLGFKRRFRHLEWRADHLHPAQHRVLHVDLEAIGDRLWMVEEFFDEEDRTGRDSVLLEPLAPLVRGLRPEERFG